MKKWIITAAVLVVAGAIICFAAAAAVHFDLGQLDQKKYSTNVYAVDESFRSISVDISSEKLQFRTAEDGKCTVVCFEEEHMRHDVGVDGGTLTIRQVDGRRLEDHVGFNFRSQEITVYLPGPAYADLRVETDTGDVDIPADFSFDSITVRGDTSDVTCRASAAGGIEIGVTTGDLSLEDITAGRIDLKVTTGGVSAAGVNCEADMHIRTDTGKVRLRDVRCASLASEGTTGDIALDSVIAEDTISIVRDTGDVSFDASDAAAILVQTSTGDVAGSFLTEKIFITDTDTGRVEVPKSVAGGRCEISTDTGDIRLEVR